jgi:2-iminoacetate synthase
MFSEELDDLVVLAQKVGHGDLIDPGETVRLLRKAADGCRLEAEEIVNLMAGTHDPGNRQAILGFSADYERPHEREILLLPPLYFSSVCENQCLYCDFSSQGECLGLDDFANEFTALMDMGYRSIELVSSQDADLYRHGRDFDVHNQMYSIDRALEYFRVGRSKLDENGGGMLTCNVPPLDTASMRRLKDVGLDCFLLWLECFEPGQYAKLHSQTGPKANQAFRVDSFERAADAGIEHLAGAFLKGLSDWRREEVVLYMMDRYLSTRNGRGFSIIGTPRLKGRFAKSELVNRFRVSDEDYELNIALDRVLFDGILWLQTRESFKLNRRFLNRFGGGVILTLSCSTAPGGYSRPARAKPQFPVYNERLAASVASLEEDGFRVHLDWDSRTLTGFARSAPRSPGR